MTWLEALMHRAKVTRALSWSAKYPEELPDPILGPISARQQARIDGLESVCLFLGPYRNLTTLTASVLALHPQCQVLNHAGPRIFDKPELNFLSDYTEEKFQQFCHFALTMSQGGRRGGYGGSIVLSHAFAEHAGMREIFQKRYGSNLLKADIKCLAWKESEMVGRYIREHKVDMSALIKKNRRLKFLLPIRNPLDCSLSIARIGISKFYPELKNDQLHALLDSILEEIKWFLDLSVKFPDQFFYFYQHAVDANVLRALAKFLGLSEDERWIKDSLSVYKLKGAYTYEPEFSAHYASKIKTLFSGHPAALDQLTKMSQPA